MNQLAVVALRTAVFVMIGVCLLKGSMSIVFVWGCTSRACGCQFFIAWTVLMVLLLAEAVEAVCSLDRPGRLAVFGLVLPAATMSIYALAIGAIIG